MMTSISMPFYTNINTTINVEYKEERRRINLEKLCNCQMEKSTGARDWGIELAPQITHFPTEVHEQVI